MTVNFFYKLRNKLTTYLFLLISAGLAIICHIMSSDLIAINFYQKTVIWPVGVEFFAELLFAIVASWISVGDFVNGTSKNILASGNSKVRYYLNTWKNTLLFIAGLFVFSTVLYWIINGLKYGIDLNKTEIFQYIYYMVPTFLRYMMIASVCVLVVFVMKDLKAVFVSFIVLFLFMFLDSATSVVESLSVIKPIMEWLPVGIAKRMRDESLFYAFSLKSMCLYSLPEIVIIVLSALCGVFVFTKADE